MRKDSSVVSKLSCVVSTAAICQEEKMVVILHGYFGLWFLGSFS